MLQNFICAALLCLGLLLPDWYLGYFTKMLSCTIPLTTLVSVVGFSLLLSFVANRRFLLVIITLITITQAVQLNHWAYFGAPITSSLITKAFTEFEEIFQTGAACIGSLWRVWLAQAVSLALMLCGVYVKRLRVFPHSWLLVVLVFVVNPTIYYFKGNRIFYTKPISSTIYNTLRVFSYWMVHSQVKLHDFHYQPYQVTYGPVKVKNVVLIMGESLSSRCMQLYGYKEPNTPFLASLKDDPNFAFVKGVSSGVDTLSGLQLFFNVCHNPGFNDLVRSKTANLFRLARHQGFKTFLVSAQGDGLFHEVGAQFMDYYAFKKDNLAQLRAKGDAALLDVLANLEIADKNFIVLHLRHIHSPFTNWGKYSSKGKLPKRKSSRTNQTQQEYSDAITYHDEWVSQCIACVKQKLPKDTIVIFTSDHGELVGEDGLFGHNMMRLEVVGVPVWAYVIDAPGDSLNAYLRSQKICSHYDLGKQIAKLFGAEIFNPNEDPVLQFIHGTELETNYEFMPWQKINGKVQLLKTELIGVTAK